MRRAIMLAVLGGAHMVPASASADSGDELDAGSAVERKVTSVYRGYDFVATCDQNGRRIAIKSSSRSCF